MQRVRLDGRRLQGWLGSGLLILGIGLLGATAAMYAYGQYEKMQFDRMQVERDRIEAATATVESLRVAYETGTAHGLATATMIAEATAEASRPTATPIPAGVPAPPPRPTGTPTPRPPTPTAVPVVIRKIVAPAIGLDAPVVESKLEKGEWLVPKFVAGHLEGTAQPGDGSNIVLSGHVQSISSGNVFAYIDKLQAGDDVTLRTNVGDVLYRIVGKNLVKPDDLSVVQPTRNEELTLITCAGTFNPLTQDYTERWIVWGARVS